MHENGNYNKQLIKLLNKTLKDLLKGRINQSPQELTSKSLLQFIPKGVNFSKHTAVSFIAKRIMLDYFVLAMESNTTQIPSLAQTLADDIVSLTITTCYALYPHRQQTAEDYADKKATLKAFRVAISPSLANEFMAIMLNASYHDNIYQFMNHVITYEKLLGYRRHNITLYHFEYLPSKVHKNIQASMHKFTHSYQLTTALTNSYIEFIHRTRFTSPLRSKITLLLMLIELILIPGFARLDSLHIGIRLFSCIVNSIVLFKIASLFFRDLSIERRLTYSDFHHFLLIGTKVEKDISPNSNHASAKCRCCDCQRYSQQNQNIIVWRTMLKAYQNVAFIQEIESLRVTFKLPETIDEISDDSKQRFTETITTCLVTKERGHYSKSEHEASESNDREDSLIPHRRDKSSENIVLPSGEKGSLIYGRNNRLMLIYNNTKIESESDINFNESSACGLREARAKGQGGYKYLRKNVSSIKFAGNQQRVLCNRGDNVNIEIDGEIKSVPSFHPTKSIDSANKKRTLYKRL